VALILIIDDDETVREGVEETARRMGHEVLTAESGEKGVAIFEKRPAAVVFTDLKMDGMGGIGVVEKVRALSAEAVIFVMTGFGTIETAVTAMQKGASDFITKENFQPARIRAKIDAALDLYKTRVENDRLRQTVDVVSRRDVIPPSTGEGVFMGMIGASGPMRELFAKIEKIAKTDTNVHVSGESGTGKELVAQAIHDCSKRAQGPLIKVNCGAIPESLLESELFGHEKGAFTGAVKRKLGRFELADKGSIFLDEIGEVSAAMQVKLLRVLQQKEIERVGGESTLKVDVRVISATNRDLKAEVEAGRFREDLFYRLHIVPLHISPLRERTDDIVPLARHFVEKLRKRTNDEIRGLDPAIEAHLRAYHYPGNVRELENIIEQAMVFATPPYLKVEDLPPQVSGAKPKNNTVAIPAGDQGLDATLEAIERQMILAAYEQSGGVKTETARRLRIKTSALYYKLEKYGIGTVAGRTLDGGSIPPDEGDPGS